MSLPWFCSWHPTTPACARRMSISWMPAGAECVCPIAARLGEGPIWSARERAVWFVDIKGRCIHRFNEAARTTQTWQAPQDVGFVVPASAGRFICGLKSGLHLFAPQDGSFRLLAEL